jgi:hypothetical protein
MSIFFLEFYREQARTFAETTALQYSDYQPPFDAPLSHFFLEIGESPR